MLLQPQDQTGINAPGARRHDEALEWRESHRGVDRPTAIHRTERSARAKVAGDASEGVDWPADQLGGAACGPRVGEPVKPEATQVPTRAPFLWQCVGRCGTGHAGMKSGVEARHRGYSGEDPAHSLDGAQRLRLVQRR